MMDKKKNDDRIIKLLQIFLEHPGGLRFSELWKIVNERGIYSKATLYKRLRELMENGLIIQDELNHYMLDHFGRQISKAVADMYALSKRVEKFFESLFQAFEEADCRKPELFGQLGLMYLSKESHILFNQMAFLYPYLFDRRIREVWFMGVKYNLDLLMEKVDEMARKLHGSSAAQLFTAALLKGKVVDVLGEKLNAILSQLQKEYEKISNLIDRLEIKDEMKKELKELAL